MNWNYIVTNIVRVEFLQYSDIIINIDVNGKLCITNFYKAIQSTLCKNKRNHFVIVRMGWTEKIKRVFNGQIIIAWKMWNINIIYYFFLIWAIYFSDFTLHLFLHIFLRFNVKYEFVIWKRFWPLLSNKTQWIIKKK